MSLCQCQRRNSLFLPKFLMQSFILRPQSSVNMKKYKAGVLFGEELEALYNDAKDNQFALPAVNTIGTNTSTPFSKLQLK
jgi:hypothetical protein